MSPETAGVGRSGCAVVAAVGSGSPGPEVPSASVAIAFSLSAVVGSAVQLGDGVTAGVGEGDRVGEGTITGVEVGELRGGGGTGPPGVSVGGSVGTVCAAAPPQPPPSKASRRPSDRLVPKSPALSTALIEGKRNLILIFPMVDNPYPFRQNSHDMWSTNSQTRKAVKVGVLALLALLALLTAWRAILAYRYAKDLRRHAQALTAFAASDPAQVDFDAVAEHVTGARQTGERLQRTLQPFILLTDRLGWIPYLGPWLENMGPAVDFATHLTTAADEVFQSLAPLLEDPGDGPAAAGGPIARAVTLLEQATPALERAEAAAQAALADRARLQPEALPPQLAAPLLRLDPLLPLLPDGIRLLRELPSALGGDGPITYLVLAQNQDELRATGGFISGAGHVTISQGRVAEMVIRDSYDVDDLTKPYPPPPAPLQQYMGAQVWVLRDVNWSPDFPTTARRALDLYALSTGIRAQGVIAFDQTAVQRLLEVTGPVTVPGAEQPVDSSNVIDYMRQAWGAAPGEDAEPDWWEQRKAFMGELGQALLAKVTSLDTAEDQVRLLRTVYQLLREKHLLIYFENPSLQDALANLELDGALRPGAGDFLMVVDSNVGFNKVDPLIQREIRYEVDLTDLSRPQAHLVLRYRHTLTEPVPCVHRAVVREPNYRDLQRRCYWNYVRIYTVAGSQALSAATPEVPSDWLLKGAPPPRGMIQQADETGTTVFATIIVVPAGETREIQVSYLLPMQIGLEADPTYHLRLVKQPGTVGVPVQVVLRLPEWASPQVEGWTRVGPNTLSWEGRLWTDVDLSVDLSRRTESEGPIP